MPSDSGATWSPPATSERRLSNSSDGSAGSGYSKATTDSADFLATRPHTAAVLPGKPAANPLQFIKVGPADLGTRAREQLRRAELAKRTEPARIEKQEDWQSNLDNWKSSRRKRVEHIIERCVEVRRLEDQTNQPRAKSKTFNEMLEERAGRRRRNPLALYTEDDGHDLSDLGIGTSSTKSSLSEDCDTHSLASDGMDLDKAHLDMDNLSNCDNNRKLGSSANEYDTCTTTTISSPEPEEYTYEGAIEGYKSRIISQTNSNIIKTVVNNNTKDKSIEKSNGDMNKIRTSVSNKIEAKISSFQQDGGYDVKNNNQKKDLPKVDIHKRREQFERENSQELQMNKPKLPDISNKKTIKERLSCLEKYTEDSQLQKSSNDLNKLTAEVKPLKDRLSSLEKVKSTEPEKVNRISNGDLGKTKSLKERLSSLKSQNEDDLKVNRTEVKEVSVSLKERLCSLDAAKNKEVPKIAIDEENSKSTAGILKSENNEFCDNQSDNSLKLNLTGLENQMQSFCRSLDSLDINGQSSPNSFERVQSLEDFDCVEMQHNTIPSDIETEDSGIHTGKDSAPGDDIADLTQVASPLGEPMIEVSEYESSNEDSGMPSVSLNIAESAIAEITKTKNKVIFEENEEIDTKTEDTDSGSNYIQAVSQLEECSVTEEVTEIQMDKEDEDTLKSLDNQDSSVSVNETVSSASEGDTVVFEGKMTIHLNLNEICKTRNNGAGSTIFHTNDKKTIESTIKSMPMVIDALELAFQELDSEDSVNITMDDSQSSGKSDGKDIDKKDAILDFDIDKKISVTPLYENIDIFYQNSVEGEAFPLDLPSNALEPPKEKPPPPPTEETVDDELLGNGNFKHTSSARRIKKEIRNKRTSFLGIEGQIDDSYLDVDLKLAPRPDITSFLQQETKIEKLLYKKTLSHEMDAKLRDSRDSGVDIDRGPSAEAWYRGQSSPENSNAHSRQNSEPYTQVTSDEEELKKPEQFTKTLTNKLNILSTNVEHDEKIVNLDKKIEEQQAARTNEDWADRHFDDAHTKEVLRLERELLQLEQEELRRQRENLLRDQNRIIQKSVQDISTAGVPETSQTRASKPTQNYRHSMPNLLVSESYTVPMVLERTILDENSKRKPFVSEEHIQSHFGVEESRKVLYEDTNKIVEMRKQVATRPQQPVLPPKPRSRDSVEREMLMRSSRVSSAAEYVNVDRSGAARPPHGTVTVPQSGQYHPMTRHTLQALSAAPTPKLISTNEWIQPRTAATTAVRQKPPNFNYNQHWLIQEAEQRRIQEHRSKLRATQRTSYQEVGAQRAPYHDVSGVHAAQHYTNGHLQDRRIARSEIPRADPPRAVDPREEKLLSVSGKRKCSHCGDELGRGAAMIIESLSLCYHVWCFRCAVCGAALGDGRVGADVRVRRARLHCHHCYSADDGSKYSAV